MRNLKKNIYHEEVGVYPGASRDQVDGVEGVAHAGTVPRRPDGVDLGDLGTHPDGTVETLQRCLQFNLLLEVFLPELLGQGT